MLGAAQPLTPFNHLTRRPPTLHQGCATGAGPLLHLVVIRLSCLYRHTVTSPCSVTKSSARKLNSFKGLKNVGVLSCRARQILPPAAYPRVTEAIGSQVIG